MEDIREFLASYVIVIRRDYVLNIVTFFIVGLFIGTWIREFFVR